MLRPRWLVIFLWFVLLVLLAWVFMQDKSQRREQLSNQPTLAPSMPQQFQDPGRLPLVIPQFCHHYYWETADLSGDSEVDAQDALVVDHPASKAWALS